MLGLSWSRARAAPEQDQSDTVIIGADSPETVKVRRASKFAYALTLKDRNAVCCDMFMPMTHTGERRSPSR